MKIVEALVTLQRGLAAYHLSHVREKVQCLDAPTDHAARKVMPVHEEGPAAGHVAVLSQLDYSYRLKGRDIKVSSVLFIPVDQG